MAQATGFRYNGNDGMSQLNPDKDYVCTLTEASKHKAKTELGEELEEMLSSVQTLREWFLARSTWIKVPCDTSYLLNYLRAKKYSQINAREALILSWELRTKNPQWYRDIDTADSKLQAALSQGFVVPLPQRDSEGRQVIMSRMGVLDLSGKNFGPDDVIKGFVATTEYFNRDENVQVNGFVYLGDLGGFTVKHISFFGADSMGKSAKCWMKAQCGRNKALHFYNGGGIFDVFYALFKPSFPVKIQKRVTNHGNSLLPVYDVMDKSLLPQEYLPDDYNGPSAGTVQQIIDDFRLKLKNEEFRQHLKRLTSGQFYVDMAKKPKSGETENASFRQKVNV